MARTWFITGCSTGFGRAIGELVLARGENAVLTARDAGAVRDLERRYPDSALTLPLDVTKDEQIRTAVAAALERFGTVDVLVNNAGYGYRSAVEEGEDEAIRTLFDTNVFGLAALTRAVLPGMRAQRSGTIVNMSSIGGRMAFPGSGYYSATKFAVEGLSDALRKEVGPLGIRVLVVEPSGFRTEFAGSSLTQSATPIADYAGTAGARRKENDTSDGRQPGDPVRAAEAIVQAVDSARPPFRLLLGRDAVRRAEEAIEEQLADLRAWREVSEGADYDPE